MSLVETLVAIGCAAIIAMLAGLTIVSNQKQFAQTQSVSTMIETQSELKRWLTSDHAGNLACTDILKFSFGPLQYSPSSNLQTDVQIVAPGTGETYQNGKVVRIGSASFTIGKLYVADVEPIRSAGGGSDQKTSYKGTLWLEGQLDNHNNFVRRAISNVTMNLDVSGAMVNCNSSLTDDSKTNCSGITNFNLDSSDRCGTIYREGNVCPTGTVWNGQSCAPQSYVCAGNAILTEVRADLADTSGSCVPYQ